MNYFTGNCSENEFKCANYRCVPSELICDGKDNCGDWSDEHTQGCRRSGKTLSFIP